MWWIRVRSKAPPVLGPCCRLPPASIIGWSCLESSQREGIPAIITGTHQLIAVLPDEIPRVARIRRTAAMGVVAITVGGSTATLSVTRLLVTGLVTYTRLRSES